MIWTKSCGTAAKAGGNGENKPCSEVVGVPCLLEKESYQKGIANHLSPESCLDDPRGRGEALTGGSAGGLLSSEITISRRPS